MRMVALAFALASLSIPAAAAGPGAYQATLPERASGFRTLAECERALSAPRKGKLRHSSLARGTAFNRAAGNITRCEMIDGEPVMVVYPAPIHRP